MKYRKQRPRYWHPPRLLIAIRLRGTVYHFSFGKPTSLAETDERLHIS